MTYLTQSTKSQKEKDIKRQWRMIDAKGKILGRLTTEISKMIQGKDKPQYTLNMDAGDYIVVVNASKVVLTGRKEKEKSYKYYSGYPSGLKEESFSNLIKKKPGEIIRHAVSGMLPKNKLRSKRLARLFVFPDEKHNYSDKFKKVKS